MGNQMTDSVFPGIKFELRVFTEVSGVDSNKLVFSVVENAHLAIIIFYICSHS